MRILTSVLILAALAAAAPTASGQAAPKPRVPDCSKLADRERRDCEREVQRMERDRQRADRQRERERAQREAERAADRASDRDDDHDDEFDFEFDFDFDDEVDGRTLPASLDTTLNLGNAASAELSLGTGEIIVTTWNRPEARVVARTSEGGVYLAANDGVLTVQVRGRHGDPRPRGRIELTVPAGTRIQASGQSADVQVRGTKGRVRVNTMSGDVVLDDVADLVELTSISGDIMITNVAGDVEVRTVNGDVDLSDARGDVVVQSVSGDARLARVVARRVRVLTVSGDMSYDGTVEADGRYSFSTTSGDLDVVMPEGANASVTMRTFSGSIESAYPITLQPGEHRIGAATGKRFTFDVGRGGAALALESFSGTITLGPRGAATSGPSRD